MVKVYIYDTRARRKRVFEPIDSSNVTIYVCGPTVYDYIHIGNGLSAVVFDVFVRLMRIVYPTVTYVRNITDIEDKIIAASLENNEPYDELTERFVEAFHEDMDALYVLAPDVEPRPTMLLPEITDMIERLLERGHAYVAEGHVLFSVQSFPEYGKLSNRSLEDMIDGARVEVAPYKRDPKDFVLWKPSSAELPGWASPWGRGRPGWHIECSAMIREHLGPTIDIHGAGSDLVFPHNENEIAQGRCVEDGVDYVNYWMHNGMLNLGGRKMSKSLGNVVSIKHLRSLHSNETIRYALLTGHYRQSLLWNERLLDQSRRSIDTLYRSLRHVAEKTGAEERTCADFSQSPLEIFPDSVVAALSDDLHTPKALAELHAIAREIQQTQNTGTMRQLGEKLLAGAWLLGLLNRTPSDYFGSSEQIDAETIESMLVERDEARARRDFARADEIRAELALSGIEIEDTKDGTRWSNRDR